MIAAVAFVHDLVLAPAREQFAVTVSRDVSSALSIAGVLELLRTIVANSRQVSSEPTYARMAPAS